MRPILPQPCYRPRFTARFLALLPAVLLSMALAACAAATPTPPPPTPTTPGGSCALETEIEDDESAISAVLQAEGELVVAQEIDPLLGLWTEDGQVVDAHNTPDNPDDDQRWDGRDAIRHRYVRTVFPGAPAAIQRLDQTISIEGTRAVVSATTSIGDETSPASDRWELVKTDGCWYLTGLTYNLEAAP